jgi:hypothetical protein
LEGAPLLCLSLRTAHVAKPDAHCRSASALFDKKRAKSYKGLMLNADPVQCVFDSERSLELRARS